MTVEGAEDISGLIAAWGGGDEEAFSRLMALLYPELRRIARQHLGRRHAGQTLESAALANEAYLKLARAGGIRCEKGALILRKTGFKNVFQLEGGILEYFSSNKGGPHFSGKCFVFDERELLNADLQPDLTK